MELTSRRRGWWTALDPGDSCNPNAGLKTDSPRAAAATQLLSPSSSFSSSLFFGGNQLSHFLSRPCNRFFCCVTWTWQPLCTRVFYTRSVSRIMHGTTPRRNFEKRKPLYYTPVEIFIHTRFTSSWFLNTVRCWNINANVRNLCVIGSLFSLQNLPWVKS